MWGIPARICDGESKSVACDKKFARRTIESGKAGSLASEGTFFHFDLKKRRSASNLISGAELDLSSSRARPEGSDQAPGSRLQTHLIWNLLVDLLCCPSIMSKIPIILFDGFALIAPIS